MSKDMSTIRSTLIKTCISNVQKELSQLEHWLQILPDEASNVTAAAITANAKAVPVITTPSVNTNCVDSALQSTIASISHNLNALLETSNKHQQMIDYLTSRMNHNENMRVIRPVNDPWVDNNSVPLLNEIVNLCDVNISEVSSESGSELNCIYCVNKQDDSESESDVASVHPLLKTPEIHPNIPDDASDVPDIDEELGNESVHNDVKEVKEQEQQEQQEQQEKQELKETEDIQPTVDESPEETQEEEEVEVEEVEEEEAEEEEEEEEEEGLELEEIEYKGTTYYKDGEGFIYSIIDEEPSENPIGYWKEKTQSIAFYKTKQ
jgi:cobalamin biosynthesis protein CobT